MGDDFQSRLGGLPAEIRDDQFALIARTTVASLPAALNAAGATHVAGATNYISVTLPNGATVATPMTLPSAASPSSEPLPDHIFAALKALPAVSAYFAAGAEPLSSASVSPLSDDCTEQVTKAAARDLFPPQTRIRLSPGSGRHLDADAGTDLDPAHPPVRIVRRSDAPLATVSLWLGDPAPVSIVLAPGITIELAPAPLPFGVTLNTGIATVDDMMRLRSAGRVTEVSTVLGGMSPDDVLSDLLDHPGASALMGYGFLRTHEPAQILSVVEAAAGQRPLFPDARVLAGEVLARLGEHQRALDHFVAAADAGLPAFSFGMNYLVDRLRAYAALERGPIDDEAGTTRARTALDQVEGYAPAMLHAAILTSYKLAS